MKQSLFQTDLGDYIQEQNKLGAKRPENRQAIPGIDSPGTYRQPTLLLVWRPLLISLVRDDQIIG